MQMKRTALLFLMIGVFLTGLPAAIHNAYAEAADATFYVVFAKAPGLDSGDVYANEAPIGKILAKEQSKNDTVILKISIDPQHQGLLSADTVFFADSAGLNYFATADEGVAPAPDAKMLGFASKADVYWFKAQQRHATDKKTPSQIAQELYDQATK